MRLVILESPYAGEVERNVAYARAAMRHSLSLGEAPLVSHLLYTQVLDDDLPEERKLGMEAGLAWRQIMHRAVFYVDLGWSPGMKHAEELYSKEGRSYEVRCLPKSFLPVMLQPGLISREVSTLIVDNNALLNRIRKGEL